MGLQFKQLSIAQKRTFAKNLRVAFSAAGYDIVSGPDQMLRRRGTIEFGGEDRALPFYNRLRMLNMARQGVRNGDSMRALMRQMELNVVGTVGGKATFAFGEKDAQAAKDIRRAFAAWARHCEFSDGLSLSKLLQLVVDTKFVGGDMVLLFDDGLIEDSGKILAFEPDEIADVPKAWFAEKFPADFTQRQGRIYNQNGRFVGVTVSHKYRGQPTFKRDPNGVFFLTVDPDAEIQDWVMLREVWRFNQGRGVSPIAAPLDSLLDLESVTKFEVQAAMKNSQTLGQIVYTGQKKAEANPDEVSGELDADLAAQAAAVANGDGSGLTAEEQQAAAEQEAGGDADFDDDFELEHIEGSGAIFDQMPDDYKMELLDTKRPNPNVEGFVKWLSGRSGAAIGLAKCYANMEATASYTAFRGEQVMSWATFEEWQKNLEREVCDWVVQKWVAWADRKGIFKAGTLPDDWSDHVSWSWPTMREVDIKATAEAKKIMLENGLITLAELHPGDPDGYMQEIGKDVERYHRLGLIHPMEKSVSGGVLSPSVDGAGAQKSQSEKENEKENQDEE